MAGVACNTGGAYSSRALGLTSLVRIVWKFFSFLLGFWFWNVLVYLFLISCCLFYYFFGYIFNVSTLEKKLTLGYITVVSNIYLHFSFRTHVFFMLFRRVKLSPVYRYTRCYYFCMLFVSPCLIYIGHVLLFNALCHK